MLIKLDEAIAAVEKQINYSRSHKESDLRTVLARCRQALRALPVSDGWEDEMAALQAENAELNAALAEQARIMDLWIAQLDTILEELKGRK